MFKKFRETLGRVWGKTTTLVLALSVSVLPVLQGIDPDFVKAHPSFTWAMVILGIGAAVARAFAPPPPALAIHSDDVVEVDHSAGTVTVTKSSPIPEEIALRADVEKI